MALPTQKRSKSRQKRKQYQYRLKKIFLSICAKCQKLKPSHQACPFCGTYAGREIIKSDAEKRKNKNKKNEKETKRQKDENNRNKKENSELKNTKYK